MTPLAWALLAFAVCGGGTYAALERRARRGRFRARLTQVMLPAEVAPEEEPTQSAPAPAVAPWEARLRRRLRRAGLRLRPGEFLLLWAGCPLGLGAIGALLTRLPPLALLLALIGAVIPPLILRVGEDGRRRRFDGQLTDALTLLVSGLRSGYSLARAAQMVAEEMPPPVSEEFAVALGELALGLPLAAALARMTERVGSPDLDLIVTAVTTQQRVGGNLAEILTRIADTIRERVRVQGEIQTLTAEGKLSGLILSLLPPALALLLTLRNPHYFAPLLGSPLGRVLIAGAVLGQIIGAVIIRRMVRLDI
ncbi:MAG: type II secretion system F family protein [Armatimonadetes bacterium]|nr:type II secretion system F family protein [Armatimonadota bacterium]